MNTAEKMQMVTKILVMLDLMVSDRISRAKQCLLPCLVGSNVGEDRRW